MRHTAFESHECGQVDIVIRRTSLNFLPSPFAAFGIMHWTVYCGLWRSRTSSTLLASTLLDSIMSTANYRAEEDAGIAAWLMLCALMITAMVFIGGLTRLTDSGLSIVEWKPVTGVLPPLSDPDWQQLFESYQSSPEFRKINARMDLAGFKSIFWLEYLHRILGRLTGLVFLLPLLYFAARRRIGKGLALRLFGVFLLGGLQGFVGWYMVRSGLIDNPWVSPFRLALHLAMAFALFGVVFWMALSRWPGRQGTRPALPSSHGSFLSFFFPLFILQTLIGALVAGLNAGLVFNTFPLMNGQIIPERWLELRPIYLNFFENVATVQFSHRLLAFVLVATFLVYLVRTWGQTSHRRVFLQLGGVLALQFALGVLTLILRVPVSLASAHQLGALLLFAICISHFHALSTQKRNHKDERYEMPPRRA